METITETVATAALLLIFSSALVLIVFILAKYTYLTKKVLAESGEDVQPKKKKFIYQDMACIVIALGVGLTFSSLISVLNLTEDTMDLLIYGILSVSTGIGLLVAHSLRNKASKEQSNG